MLRNTMLEPLLLLLFVASSHGTSESQSAQSRSVIGLNYLGLGRIEDAKTNCDVALRLDPSNETAKDCLGWVASMVVDQELNNADAKLLQGDNKGAIELASKWTYAAMQPKQKKRAQDILARAQSPSYIFTTFAPDWLRQVLVTIVALVTLGLLLLVLRKLWREWRRAKWYGFLANTTRWSMFPLKELTDSPTGIPTDHFLDALIRLPELLRQPLWRPRLLALRPTPPADHDPAIIDGFVSYLDPPPIALSPEPDHLGLDWKEHDVQIDEAIQNLQLRTVTGLDLGAVAKFLSSIVHWFNAGGPVISGVSQTLTDGSVSIHIAASGGKTKCVSVTASTAYAPGIDVTQLTAQRVAFKLLLRMRYPEMTNNEIEGFAALRQAVVLFGQYAGTVRGTGDDAQARNSSLKQAASDFGLFRNSIPIHLMAPNKAQACSQVFITDEVRQAALLAEGVAHALVGDDASLSAAVACFRELQDCSGFGETAPLRRQAAYNEAVVWRHKGLFPRAVLMLTELLGQPAPDTERSATDRDSSLGSALTFPDADTMRFPARLARLAAFAQYKRGDWTTLPQERINLLIGDAEKLIGDLKELSSLSEHEQRIVQYIYQEALRAIGHVEVLRVICGPGARLYDPDHRPTRLRTEDRLEPDDEKRLQQAIKWMKEAEGILPTSMLYCDLSEAHLLLKQFAVAGGYARHATLQKDEQNERAFYLAAESYLLENKDPSRAFAERYAAEFISPTLPEFIALRKELQNEPESKTAFASAH